MFLAAVLRAGTHQAAVKVRNMSQRGAMLESPLTPPPGTKVYVMRGVLLAEGIITWRSNERCGVRFLSEVSVKQWLAVPPTAQQLRVDEKVSLATAGEPAAAFGKLGSGAPQNEEQLAHYLGEVVKLLEDLEDDLASSVETAARHGVKIQNLDIGMQIIRAVALELTSPRDRESIGTASLQSLRAAGAAVFP
jgi:hypothetical protein